MRGIMIFIGVTLIEHFAWISYVFGAVLILTALKKYGMILADNGGGFFVSGAPDPRWNDANIDTMKRIKGSDFEVVAPSS